MNEGQGPESSSGSNPYQALLIAGKSRPVDIVVGGLWHAPDVAAGIADLGLPTRLITASRVQIPGVEVVSLPAFRLPMRAARGNRIVDASVFRAFGNAAVPNLRSDSLVIAWSSFGLGAAERGREVLLVRGSTHVDRQRQILLDVERTTGRRVPKPNRLQAKLERTEYGAVARVSVPTWAIAEDPLWRQTGTRMNVSPYGFPATTPANSTGRREGRLLFAGQVGYRKGIDRLAAALPESTPYAQEIVLLGDPARGFPMRSLPRWWEVRGWIPTDEVRAEMRLASALVLLSREEGMARVGLEAMAAGLPLVVTRATGLDVWVEDGGGVILEDPDSSDELRHALEMLMRDWDAHSRRARRVATCWSWTDHARSLLSKEGVDRDSVLGRVRGSHHASAS